ncbi:MAG: hypothetical protein NVSMB52_05740 [Chloroflexota bacterium]
MAYIAFIGNDRDTRDLLLDVLALQEWTLLPLSSRDEALERLPAERPDLIILELWLGSRELGWQLLEELKTDSVLHNIPVILWTDSPRFLDGKEGPLTTWAVRVLPKPCDITQLFEMCETALLGDEGRGLPAAAQ